MPSPRVLILRAPGTNCDEETAFAFAQSGGTPDSVHVNRLLETPTLMSGDYQILCLPGGFSYGDDVAAGRILANQLQNHLGEVLREFHSAGKLILGICNGFQVLLKTGLLLPEDDSGPQATLTWNDSGKFEDRWVKLSISGNKCVFLSGLENLELPIAHAEGKFVARNDAMLAALDQADQLVFRYRGDGPEGASIPYPQNPNGSQRDVAGVCDSTGRVFGLMPHPERFVDRTQHPQWTRPGSPDVGQGLAVFQNAVRYFL